jgi:hypothetical protein
MAQFFYYFIILVEVQSRPIPFIPFGSPRAFSGVAGRGGLRFDKMLWPGKDAQQISPLRYASAGMRLYQLVRQ